MLVKVVYDAGNEIKVKKGELMFEDTNTIVIKTFVKEITIGKKNLIEMSQVKE